jgi:hypothetical protein
MKMDFGDRRQARIDRYKKHTERDNKKSENLFNAALSEVEHIPMGQPILLGHHSEKKHRNTLKRYDHKMRKAFEAREEADYFECKADGVENNKAISSDDPKALQKLEKKIQEAQDAHAKMVKANRLICQGDSKGLTHLFGEKLAKELQVPDDMNRIGFPEYKLKNSKANIYRMKQRLEDLQDRFEQDSVEYEINGIRVLENIEENRLQIFFENKPPEGIRGRLKSNGFKWAKSQGAWQRHLNNAARYAAECALKPVQEDS